MTVTNGMVWIFFIIIFVPICFFAVKKYVGTAKKNKEIKAELENKKAYYSHLTKEKLDQCPREDLSTAVLSHILRIESEDYDHVYENLNHSERILYIIYEAIMSLENGKGSIRTFFESDFYEPFFPMLEEAFEAIDCREISEMMRAAKHLKRIIENDEEEDEEKLGDYSNYNYGDFTNEFMTLIMTLNANEKMLDFIEQHKYDFIDEEEEGDSNESVSE